MQDNSLVVITLVGLGVICVGLLVILFLAMLRFTGHHLFGFITFWSRAAHEETGEASNYIPSAKPNLRSIAQAEDFDTALAKHIVQDEIEPHSGGAPPHHAANTPSAFTTSPTPPPPATPFPDATPRLGSRRSSNGHVSSGIYRKDEDDDALADFLDEG